MRVPPVRRAPKALFRASIVILALAVAACGGGGGADGEDDDDDDDGGSGVPATASVVRGAQLYDAWWDVVGTAVPTTTHPAYPSPGAQTGASTWRCAECHGWDYKGDAGVYAKGAHFTGIVGILANAGAPASTVFASIAGTGTAHDFSTRLTADELWDLVAFVQNGATDPSPWIDSSTGAALASATSGASLYASNCASCHGADGGTIDLGGGQDVGDRADADPWQVLHHIRWGVPATGMPSMEERGLSHAQQAAILAYAQSLSGTVTPPPPPPPTSVSYATTVAPIWSARGCTGCHGGSGGLTLTGTASASRAALLAGRVNTTTPSASLILTKPLAGSGVSHGGGKAFGSTSDADYQKILDWITQGAPNN